MTTTKRWSRTPKGVTRLRCVTLRGGSSTTARRKEYGHLGETFGRPVPERMRWYEDGSVWRNGDMWARADESSDYILGLYRVLRTQRLTAVSRSTRASLSGLRTT